MGSNNDRHHTYTMGGFAPAGTILENVSEKKVSEQGAV